MIKIRAAKVVYGKVTHGTGKAARNVRAGEASRVFR